MIGWNKTILKEKVLYSQFESLSSAFEGFLLWIESQQLDQVLKNKTQVQEMNEQFNKELRTSNRIQVTFIDE